MNYPTKSLLLVIAIILVTTLTGLSCSKKTSQSSANPTSTSTATPTQTTESNLLNADVTSMDQAILRNYELAKGKALLWKSDATLYAVIVKLPTDLGLSKANQTYVFGSAADAINWWSISIAEQSSKFVRAAIPKEDYLGYDIKPITLKFWKMNYIKALQLAEANGGEKFRKDNTGSQITATLHQALPKGWLWWEIEYKSSVTNSKLILKISPSDENVVDEQGNPVAIGGSSATPTATTTSQ